jgi:S1-C subfamily serine protease
MVSSGVQLGFRFTITARSSSNKEPLKKQSLVVVWIDPTSPLRKEGVLIGDLIVTLNDHPFLLEDDLNLFKDAQNSRVLGIHSDVVVKTIRVAAKKGSLDVISKLDLSTASGGLLVGYVQPKLPLRVHGI